MNESVTVVAHGRRRGRSCDGGLVKAGSLSPWTCQEFQGPMYPFHSKGGVDQVGLLGIDVHVTPPDTSDTV